MALGFTACSGNTLATGDKGTDMKGGFVASTNDYVYFINGVESYTTTYKTGKVTKGALMRVKKDKLAAEDAAYETVVSKLIVSDDKTAGFYINGEYVYYAVPSTENNKKGETKNDPALAKELASMAELYVSDAFGTVHRAHASTAGVAYSAGESPKCWLRVSVTLCWANHISSNSPSRLMRA